MITYSSNVKAVRQILLDCGSDYTHQFLHEAEADLERMKKFFLVPAFDLKPAVYMQGHR